MTYHRPILTFVDICHRQTSCKLFPSLSPYNSPPPSIHPPLLYLRFSPHFPPFSLTSYNLSTLSPLASPSLQKCHLATQLSQTCIIHPNPPESKYFIAKPSGFSHHLSRSIEVIFYITRLGLSFTSASACLTSTIVPRRPVSLPLEHTIALPSSSFPVLNHHQNLRGNKAALFPSRLTTLQNWMHYRA